MARNTSSWMAAALLLFGCEQTREGAGGEREQRDRSEEMGSRDQEAPAGKIAAAAVEPIGGGHGRGTLTFTSTDAGARVVGSFTGMPKGNYDVVLARGTSCADAGSRRIDASDAQTRPTPPAAGEQPGTTPPPSGARDEAMADRRLGALRVGDDGVAQIDEIVRGMDMSDEGVKGHLVLLVPEAEREGLRPLGGEPEAGRPADEVGQLPVACGALEEGSRPKPEPRG